MRWLRSAEIALSVIGLSLLGVAGASVVNSRIYQARQGRAFSLLEQSAVASALIPESPVAIDAKPSTAAPAGDPLLLGRIEITRLGISAIVREGADDATLAVAVGHIPGTARPGERGNMALAGHRDTFFRALEEIQLDDAIRFRTAGRVDVYLVDSIEVVAPEETRVLDPTDDAVLTLVTCHPFVWIGHAPNRFIVRASRLDPSAGPEPPVQIRAEQGERPHNLREKNELQHSTVP